jgi:hypothetical protein
MLEFALQATLSAEVIASNLFCQTIVVTAATYSLLHLCSASMLARFYVSANAAITFISQGQLK